MKLSPAVRNILLIWLGWAVVLSGFQWLVQMRVSLERPDFALLWTPSETRKDSNDDNPFLMDPFLNSHVAWDSEYYLAIAVDGYESARVPAIIAGSYSSGHCLTPDRNCYQLSYAFFPLYSILTRLVAFPLKIFAMTEIARATLAGVIVSLLGALGAMLSLYSMCRKQLGEEGGVRAAFYLLIFPSGFFLAQIYSEGVFIGVTFAALAFLTARKWGWAAAFGALAVWTRPGGAILALPFLIVWLMDKTSQKGTKTAVLRMLAVLAPVLSYGAWRLTPLATKFFIIEDNFFGRGLLAISDSWQSWTSAWQIMLDGRWQARVYYGLEFAAVLLAVVTCLLLLRKRPELALYGLALVFFAFTSGTAQGMVRYVLAAPPLFYVLAHWGKHPAFDRVWTIACVLLMGLEAMLFSFDFWVA